MIQTSGRICVPGSIHKLFYKARAKTAPATRAKTPEAPLTEAAPVELAEEPVWVPLGLPVELEVLLAVRSVLLTPETQVVPFREKGTLTSL